MHVDDDVIIQKITSQALESLGKFEVRTFSCGEEALEGIEDFQPDLILIDMVMPGMGGPKALFRLREEEHILDIPVIFVTGNTEDRIDLDDMTMGVIGLIKKPYQPQELVDRVNELWIRHYA